MAWFWFFFFYVLCLYLRCQVLENTRKCTVVVVVVREVAAWRERAVKPTLNFQINLRYKTTSFNLLWFFKFLLSPEWADFICQSTCQFSNSYIALEAFGVGTVRIPNQHACDWPRYCRIKWFPGQRSLNSLWKCLQISKLSLLSRKWWLYSWILLFLIMPKYILFSLKYLCWMTQSTDSRSSKDLIFTDTHYVCLFIGVLRNSSHKKLLIVLQCTNMIKDLDCRQARVWIDKGQRKGTLVKKQVAHHSRSKTKLSPAELLLL